jgi:hypothetical protein
MPSKRSKIAQLPVIEPNAAGIDVGATQIFVAVPADRDPEPIRCFETFTVELERLADWLHRCRIQTVAMESNGVYWIPLFHILEKRRIEVRLVNAYHVRNVRAERQTWKTAIGFNTSIRSVSCAGLFGRMMKSVQSVRCGGTAKA